MKNPMQIIRLFSPLFPHIYRKNEWGEGLEQREIKVEDGELYLSFWDSSDRFFIKPEDELKGSQSFVFGITMGGMR